MTLYIKIPIDCHPSSAGVQALKALLRRELTLVQRNSFLYVFKAVQVTRKSLLLLLVSLLALKPA